jgi:SAM-dependent MidA family methyltransferase
VPSAADDVRDAIVEAGGALRFDRFVEHALYGPSGFYTSGGGSAGRRGDFITSPEVGPLFGTVLARAIDEWWRESGSPSDHTILEIGAGPGTLARSVVAAEPRALAAGGRYVAVEISAEQRSRHPHGVDSCASLDEVAGRASGIVIANELVDNVPFRLLVFDGGWREAFVVDAGDGRFAEVLREVESPVPSWLPSRASHGARMPVHERAGELLRTALARLGHGRLVMIDYCSPASGLLAQRPWREWLRTYRSHERGEHYLRSVGEQDITVEVAIDQLVDVLGEPVAVRSQAQFLQRWGIDELVEEGRREWAAKAHRPDLGAMRMRSRVSESEALLDPSGLGGFTVVEWSVG